MFKKSLSIALIVAFFLTSLGPIPKAHADVLNLPIPGTMVNLSPAYEPVMIKGLTVHKDNPFLFDFIVDVGDSGLSVGNADLRSLQDESTKLIKYFLASLAIPEKDLWVNLSPYEKDRTIPEELSKTDMGRDLLAQDYILKQITASLIYPEKALGKTFWDKVYTKAQQLYGTTEVPVNTFNKVWIMADKAEVFERNNTAFVTDSHLKVMLEEDYLALEHQGRVLQSHDGTRPAHQLAGALSGPAYSPDQRPAPRMDAHTLASDIVRQIILPELEKEVNTGKNFANLRQIFNSLILASWYKKNLKEALLNQVYSNQSKVKGIERDVIPAKAGIQSKDDVEAIYNQYLAAYKKGVFNYIKEDIDKAKGTTIPRKYFSGGMQIAPHDVAMTTDPQKLANALPKDRALVSFQTGMMDHVVAVTPTPDRAMINEMPEKLRGIFFFTDKGAVLRLPHWERFVRDVPVKEIDEIIDFLAPIMRENDSYASIMRKRLSSSVEERPKRPSGSQEATIKRVILLLAAQGYYFPVGSENSKEPFSVMEITFDSGARNYYLTLNDADGKPREDLTAQERSRLIGNVRTALRLFKRDLGEATSLQGKEASRRSDAPDRAMTARPAALVQIPVEIQLWINVSAGSARPEKWIPSETVVAEMTDMIEGVSPQRSESGRIRAWVDRTKEKLSQEKRDPLIGLREAISMTGSSPDQPISSKLRSTVKRRVFLHVSSIPGDERTSPETVIAVINEMISKQVPLMDETSDSIRQWVRSQQQRYPGDQEEQLVQLREGITRAVAAAAPDRAMVGKPRTLDGMMDLEVARMVVRIKRSMELVERTMESAGRIVRWYSTNKSGLTPQSIGSLQEAHTILEYYLAIWKIDLEKLETVFTGSSPEDYQTIAPALRADIRQARSLIERIASLLPRESAVAPDQAMMGPNQPRSQSEALNMALQILDHITGTDYQNAKRILFEKILELKFGAFGEAVVIKDPQHILPLFELTRIDPPRAEIMEGLADLISDGILDPEAVRDIVTMEDIRHYRRINAMQIETIGAGSPAGDLIHALEIFVGVVTDDSVSGAKGPDQAMAAKGGIDLNAGNMKWSVRKDGSGVEMKVDPALIERIKREGIDSLTPVIFRVTPVVSIWPLVGLDPPKKEEERLVGV
ncbi:MAG: hypothetical protein Q7K71_06145 [Candidatus Omnitrophota bacterium]|nr:hypothetical protein [Candidatus Omnitrophota bacterium]